MNAPARLGFRHALHPVNAGFELEPGIDALALHMGGELLHPAKVGFLMLQHLEPPAHPLGITLIHPGKVAREQACLLAARAGADFQNGGAGVGCIFRQQRDAQRLLHLGDTGLEGRDLILGQGLHLGVGQHRLGLGQIVQRAGVGGDFFGHRLQLGIFAADPRNLGGRGPGMKLRLEKLETLGDLGEFFQRNHGPGLADGHPAVKRASPGALPRTPGYLCQDEVAGLHLGPNIPGVRGLAPALSVGCAPSGKGRSAHRRHGRPRWRWRRWCHRGARPRQYRRRPC